MLVEAKHHVMGLLFEYDQQVWRMNPKWRENGPKSIEKVKRQYDELRSALTRVFSDRDRLANQNRELWTAVKNAMDYLQGRPNCDGLNRVVNELEDLLSRVDASEQ